MRDYPSKKLAWPSVFLREHLSGWLKAYPLTGSEIQAKIAASPRNTGMRKIRDDASLHSSRFMSWANVEALTRSDKGRLAEAAVLFRLSLMGLRPFRAFGDGAREDWL